MRQLLQVERALGAGFADAWPRARDEALVGYADKERGEWVAAFDWAKPFFALAYLNAPLPEGGEGVAQLRVMLEEPYEVNVHYH